MYRCPAGTAAVAALPGTAARAGQLGPIARSPDITQAPGIVTLVPVLARLGSAEMDPAALDRPRPSM